MMPFVKSVTVVSIAISPSASTVGDAPFGISKDVAPPASTAPVSVGASIVGDVPNTSAPDPVSFVTAAARLADDGVPKNVATFVPSPAIPVDTGRPVQLVRVPDVGVPRTGVTSVGVFAKTRDPVPVSSVTADAKLALEGVPRNVATPVPSPEMPVDIGSPVAFVRTAADGVPRLGVVKDGDVAKTRGPEPVSSVTAAARFADDGVARKVAMPVPNPDIPVDTGRPVAFVSTPADGVPISGVTSVGDVSRTTAPEPVTPLERLDADGCAETTEPSVPICVRNSLLTAAYE